MSQRTSPPFRADHVGSLLRPAALAEARKKWRQKEIGDADLKAIEDTHVKDVVALQEGAGIKAVTDGEFRRDYWHLDFLCAFEGIDYNEELYGMKFQGGLSVGTQYVAGKVGAHSGYMREHFSFLNDATRATAKFCIPAPGMVNMRAGRAGVDENAYPDMEEFWADLITAYEDEILAMSDLGCTYLQLDDTSMAYLCDQDFRAQIRARGDDPDVLIETYAKASSAAIANRPAGMTVTAHTCRGNFQSTYMMTGGYEPSAEIMFNNLDVDGYFLEFDSDRAGSFEPLRFLPEDKIVVAGLITTKTPELEAKDDIKRRLDDVAEYVPLERVCLSPQCGFASTHHGNKLTEDEQKRKLALVVEIADEVWGET